MFRNNRRVLCYPRHTVDIIQHVIVFRALSTFMLNSSETGLTPIVWNPYPDGIVNSFEKKGMKSA